MLIEGPAGTGKTTAVCATILRDAELYPGSRQLMARKTRASMTESVLVTWEEKILGPGHPALAGPARNQRNSYRFPNGSMVVVGGLDNPERTFSTEYDRVVVFEATEASLDDAEKLLRSLRNGVMPYQQLMCDCNPDQPQHWLNQRCISGQMLRLISRHKDNPSLSREYLDRLSKLTGVRRNRLYLGLWSAAEGIVLEGWDPAIHLRGEEVLPRYGLQKLVKFKWTLMSVDWGFRNAGVIQVWGVDHDDRMYRLHEVYETGRTIDWWIAKAQALEKKYRCAACVCDPAEPGFIQQFRQAGLNAKEANNDIAHGLDIVRDRLRVDASGKPGLYVIRDGLEARDPALVEARKPTCLEEEIPAYVYPKDKDGRPIKEKPDEACADHACDTMRYACEYVKRYDCSEPEEAPRFAAGTYGAVLGHETVQDAPV